MTLDDDSLTGALATAARAAFEQLRAENPDERFYCYALYTTGEYRWISPLVCGENALRNVATSYDENDIENQMLELRWSPADSPYMEMGLEHFDPVEALLAALPHIYDLSPVEFRDRVDRVHACCTAALQRLDADGFFGAGAERDAVIVNILQGDQSNRSRLDNAKVLNPPAAWDRLAAALPVTREVGTFTTMGDGMYQINDMVVCGEVIAAVAAKRALAWRGDELKVDVELRANAWSVAAADDGLLTAVDGKLSWLGLGGGSRDTDENHAAHMAALALSPDGRLWIWAAPDGVLIASRDGDEVWRVERWASDLALSADVQRVYVAGTGVCILDAATGAEVGQLVADSLSFKCVAVSSTGGVAAGCDQVREPGRLVVWSPDGDLVGNLAIPDLLAESARSESYRPTGCVGVAFSPDGARIASAHTSGELHIWDAAVGEHVTTVRGRHESLCGCGWLDDSRVALAGRDVDEGPAVYIFDM